MSKRMDGLGGMEDLGKTAVRPEVREYCLLGTCRREYLSQHFGTSVSFCGPQHDCCGNCGATCKCASCLGTSVRSSPSSTDRIIQSRYDPETAEMVHAVLKAVFQEVNLSIESPMDPTLITGLTSQLLDDNVNNYHIFDEIDLLQANYFYIHPKYCTIIHSALQQTLSI